MAPTIQTSIGDRAALESVYDFFVGDYIGQGLHRAVYEDRHNPKQVVKLCVGDVYQNVLEWEAWNAVSETDLAKWFAPCGMMSGDGRVLLQKKTTPIAFNKLPDKVPAFFTDLKRSNWGLLNGKPVCNDYALHLLKENGMTKRMRKAYWEDY